MPRPIAWVLSDNGTNSADGSPKDTLKNIQERSDFIVHIAHRELAPQVTATSASLPRLKNARIAFVCSKERVLEVGKTPQGVVFGNVHHVYVDDAAAQEDDGGRITVDPLARIGGNDYALFGETVTVARPK